MISEGWLKVQQLLEQYLKKLESILEKAGVDPTTMTSTVFRGAHPGGTAAIGEVVDKNLKTEIDGLYVSDASVIPVSPGKPPILLILALALRLANHLKEEVIN